jgi:hypothetical protein
MTAGALPAGEKSMVTRVGDDFRREDEELHGLRGG